MKAKNVMVALALLVVMLVLPFSAAAQPVMANGNARGNAGAVLTPDDQMEVATMQTQLGAQVRMLQLQRSIQANIDAGNEVIASIQAMNATNITMNTTELEAMVAELQGLLDQIKAVDYNNMSTKDLVTEFVAFKKQAIQISQEFRTFARRLVSENEAARIREKIVAKEKASLGEISQQIQEAKKRYNAERLRAFMKDSGFDNETLVQGYINGQINLGQIMASVRASINALGPEKKKNLDQREKEIEAKRNVFKTEAQAKVKEYLGQKRVEIESKIQERVQEHLKDRLEQIKENTGHDIEDVIGRMNVTRGNLSINVTAYKDAKEKARHCIENAIEEMNVTRGNSSFNVTAYKNAKETIKLCIDNAIGRLNGMKDDVSANEHENENIGRGIENAIGRLNRMKDDANADEHENENIGHGIENATEMNGTEDNLSIRIIRG